MTPAPPFAARPGAPPGDTAHGRLAAHLRSRLGAERVSTDPLRNAALGGDASAYHLVPQVVVDVADEADVVVVLAAAAAHATPVTFRAAGTSLSGQGVTDSVLVRVRRGFETLEPAADGRTVRLGAGVVGSHANLALAPFHRRIGPDPASLHVACVGGIVANNASGMCCGPGQDAFHTLRALRAVLADGTVVDTHDAAVGRLGARVAGGSSRSRDRTCSTRSARSVAACVGTPRSRRASGPSTASRTPWVMRSSP